MVIKFLSEDMIMEENMITTSSLLSALNKECNNNTLFYIHHNKNVVAERKNYTLKEMANCMIQSKGLSLQFWDEAINCANHIVNRILTKALQGITTEEVWSKIKPDVIHFCVFGSEAWANIPDEKRKALQPKSEKCISVGYSEDVKGYH